MRGVFANPARNFATHSDVIALQRGADGYVERMGTITALSSSFLLFATLFGLALPERSSHGAQADALHAVLLIPDSLCGEGSGHGTCQLVVADQLHHFNLMAVAGPSHFEITPVMADSCSFDPHTPPPRQVV